MAQGDQSQSALMAPAILANGYPSANSLVEEKKEKKKKKIEIKTLFCGSKILPSIEFITHIHIENGIHPYFSIMSLG